MWCVCLLIFRLIYTAVWPQRVFWITELFIFVCWFLLYCYKHRIKRIVGSQTIVFYGFINSPKLSWHLNNVKCQKNVISLSICLYPNAKHLKHSLYNQSRCGRVSWSVLGVWVSGALRKTGILQKPSLFGFFSLPSSRSHSHPRFNNNNYNLCLYAATVWWYTTYTTWATVRPRLETQAELLCTAG